MQQPDEIPAGIPTIAKQNTTYKNADYTLQQPWPTEVYIQWGDRGIVIDTKTGGTRTTAFFEVFPHAGTLPDGTADKGHYAGAGFVRGEGACLTAAEADAFAKFAKRAACPHNHISRRSYTNGLAFCNACGAGVDKLRPITASTGLGNWRTPASPSTADIVLMAYASYAAGEVRDPEWLKRGSYVRRCYLRWKHNGSEGYEGHGMEALLSGRTAKPYQSYHQYCANSLRDTPARALPS